MVIDRKELQAEYSNKHRLEISSICKSIAVTTPTHYDATEAHIEEAVRLGATITGSLRRLLLHLQQGQLGSQQ